MERRIQTYNRRGVTPDKTKSHHAIIYTGSEPPPALPRETPRTGEDPMGAPIRVIPIHRSYKMEPTSRINFYKPYTVEHNVKVFHFGQVPPDDRWKLEAQFRKAWDLSPPVHPLSSHPYVQTGPYPPRRPQGGYIANSHTSTYPEAPSDQTYTSRVTNPNPLDNHEPNEDNFGGENQSTGSLTTPASSDLPSQFQTLEVDPSRRRSCDPVLEETENTDWGHDSQIRDSTRTSEYDQSNLPSLPATAPYHPPASTQYVPPAVPQNYGHGATGYYNPAPPHYGYGATTPGHLVPSTYSQTGSAPYPAPMNYSTRQPPPNPRTQSAPSMYTPSPGPYYHPHSGYPRTPGSYNNGHGSSGRHQHYDDDYSDEDKPKRRPKRR